MYVENLVRLSYFCMTVCYIMIQYISQEAPIQRIGDHETQVKFNIDIFVPT